MFWAGVATVVRLFTHSTEEGSEPNASDATDSSELQEISSTQRESSDTISQVSLREWPPKKSLSTGSSFSEAMKDCVTADQQRRAEQNAMALNSLLSEELTRTGQWIQDNRGELISSQTAGLWPNSNQTAAEVTPVRTGCSGTPKDNDSPASKDTDAILEGMTYVGGMNYAKYRLEARRAKTSGKQKTRPPALCVQDKLARDGTTSTTSSRKSSAYRVVEEAATARFAVLQAETEAQRALACLADTRAECNEQHKVMTAELEALQDSVKGSLRRATQQTTVQAAKMDAMGYRLEEMKDLFLQRELRVEARLAELSDQIRTQSGAVSHTRTPEIEQTETAEPIASTSKMVPMRTPNPSITLKTSPKTQPNVVIPPPINERTTKVHVCTPNPLSDTSMPPATSLTRTRDQRVDPMPITSSTFDLNDTTATAGSRTSSTEEEAYATARMRTTGTNSLFLTASEGMLTGKPCASSTRQKDNANGELSVQATRGSQDNSPAPSEGEEMISPEQLRFTAAISKAMSKELAPLLAGRDQTQAKPSVYRGSKESSIDCWIPVMRRYLQRTKAKQPLTIKLGALSDTWKVKLAITLSTKPSPKGIPLKWYLNG